MNYYLLNYAEETCTTARLCCGIFRDSGSGYKTADLLTYVCLCLRVEAPTVAPSWHTLRDVCLMNCNHHAFTQCVNDVINTLVTSHVDNGSACHDVIAYVIIILLVIIIS